jgi:hypothetical protein
MITLEEVTLVRLVTLSVMAATLEAGDRARQLPSYDRGDHANVIRIEDVEEYAARAIRLFDAVDHMEGERVERLDAEARS